MRVRCFWVLVFVCVSTLAQTPLGKQNKSVSQDIERRHGECGQCADGSNGNYSFARVESGLYSLSISSQGFRTSQFSQLSLRPGFNSNINATLNAGSTAGTIEVSSLNTIQKSILTSAATMPEELSTKFHGAAAR